MLAWLYLAAAIATEVVGTVFLRFTDGFTRPAPSILVVLTYAGSLWAPTRLTPVMAEQATQGRRERWTRRCARGRARAAARLIERLVG